MEKDTIVMMIIFIFLGTLVVLFPKFLDLSNMNPFTWAFIVIVFFAGPRLAPLFFENNPFKGFFNKEQNMNPLHILRLFILLGALFIFLIKKYNLF